MTTIAWDGKSLSADKQGELCGTRTVTTKIRRLSDGRLLGCAGFSVSLAQMANWLEKGGEPPSLQAREDFSSHLLEIGLDGSITLHTKIGASVLEVPFFAVGSGMDFAIAAMHLGRTSREAIEVAMAHDPATGAGIDTLFLSPQETYHV